MDKKPNRLIKEKSPYLLQHAYNPVMDIVAVIGAMSPHGTNEVFVL